MEPAVVIEIFSKVWALSETQVKSALFGLIMVVEGGGKIPIRAKTRGLATQKHSRQSTG